MRKRVRIREHSDGRTLIMLEEFFPRDEDRGFDRDERERLLREGKGRWVAVFDLSQWINKGTGYWARGGSVFSIEFTEAIEIDSSFINDNE